MKPARPFYALAIILIPLSFGVKEMIDLKYWLDPTLVLCLLVFLLWPTPPVPIISIAVVAFAVLSAYIGTLYLPPVYSDVVSLYHIFKEPLRLSLVMVLFWTTIRFLKEDRRFVMRWISIGAIAQCIVALYLILAVSTKVPYPDFLKTFVKMHTLAQWVTLGGVDVPRACGTFFESPPFGLFMFSSFLLLYLESSSSSATHDRLRSWGLGCSILGTIGSLSGQVLLGFLPLVMGGILSAKRGSRAARVILALIVLMAIPFLGAYIMEKADTGYRLASAEYNPIGSNGERIFHARFAENLLQENPWAWLTGLGPGRYGEYAKQTGLFPDSVTPQITPVAWLCGYGIPGTLLIIGWLFLISKNAVKAFGFIAGMSAISGILLANMFQANWKSESFVVALAYLYASPLLKKKVSSRKVLDSFRAGTDRSRLESVIRN